jgi:hypothetical protein
MKESRQEIAAAILYVMKAVKGMEKNSKVGSGRATYNGTKDQDVKEVFNEAMAERGLSILPIDIEEETEVSRWVEETQYGKKQKQSVFTKVKTKYLLLHSSGESIELAGYGHGVDSQDKGAGKATTYALKNCLLYTFLTPVGKIDDTETTHSNEIEQPKVKPQKKRLIANSKEFKNGIEKKVSYEKMKEYYFITEEVATEYIKQLS